MDSFERNFWQSKPASLESYNLIMSDLRVEDENMRTNDGITRYRILKSGPYFMRRICFSRFNNLFYLD